MLRESETLGTLDKGLSVLTAFTPRKPEWGVGELAHHLNINKTTVHKVLATYQHWGMIRQDPATRRYRLGLRLVELAQAVSPLLGLREAAHPELERLAALSGETAKLSVPDQDESFCIDAVEGREQMRMTGQVGMRNPLYAGASNKVIFAFFPWPEIERITAGRASGDHLSRTDPLAFRQHLEDIVRAGYAISTSEVELGVTAISAPLRDSSGQAVASVSIAGPTTRLTEDRLPTLVDLVRTAAAATSGRLGFKT